MAAAAAKPSLTCRQGEEFFNTHKGTCVPCSQCLENTHPHRMCYDTKDTLCLPFGPFEFIQSDLAPVTTKMTTESIDLDQPEVEKPETASATSEQMEATLLVVDESLEDEWFTITLALVGILVVACLAVLVLLLVSCYLCKRKNKQRQIFYDSSADIKHETKSAICPLSCYKPRLVAKHTCIQPCPTTGVMCCRVDTWPSSKPGVRTLPP